MRKLIILLAGIAILAVVNYSIKIGDYARQSMLV